MRSQRPVTFLLTYLLVMPVGALAAGDGAAGKVKSATCAACHGPEGNSTNPVWPNLAGQHPGYLVKQLQEFRTGRRVDPAMSPMAAPLSDEDIADIAAFYASQKVRLSAADPSQVRLGERLYRGGNAESGVAACMACHGPGGAGNPPARFPALSGQHPAYVVKSLQDYRSGARQNDPNGMMRNIAERLTDHEIRAVAEYVSGLHG
jgi:cytochrome c553